MIPASPGSGWKNPVDIDEDSDSILSPYFTQPTQIVKNKTIGSSRGNNIGKMATQTTQPTQIINRSQLGASKMGYSQTGTQPTQIINRNTLGSLKVGATKSGSDTTSPRSEVEVPRSSPFKSSPAQQPQRRSGIFSFMGPAGTTFRPPQKIIAKTTLTNKNGKTVSLKSKWVDDRLRDAGDESGDELHQSPTYALSDSSDEERLSRGDIQRSSFQRQAPSASPKKVDASPIQRASEFTKYDPRTQLRAKKLQKRVGSHISIMLCAKALKAKNGDMDAAARFLEQSSPREKLDPTLRDSPKRSSTSRNLSPSPAPKRRRLVRGDNLKSQSAAAPLISLIDSDSEDISNDKDDGDNYASDSESAAEAEDGESDIESRSPGKTQATTSNLPIGVNRTVKILRYLESCTTESLAANAKISKEASAFMISKRPFRTVSQVRAVHQFKMVRKKKQRVDLGEDVFDELNQYIKRLEAIDRIVQQCETQGGIIKAKVDQWQMDQLGKIKESTALTATNCVLPFPKEPQYMKGHCKMSPYQLYGMNWLFQLYSRGSGGILADDMGLGKTCQTISFIALLVDVYNAGHLEDKPWPNLVVVPPSILANWENEFAKFAPGLSVIKYSGTPTQRDILGDQIMESPEDYHVVLTSYSQMSRPRDANWMNKIGVNAAVFDEGHRLKNPDTKLYKDLIRIEAAWKLFITGTPIQNNIMELMSLLSFISPRLFKRDRDLIEELFTQKASLQEVSEGAALHSDRIQRARGILEPFILLRKKEVVLTTLPPKTRKVVYCEMSGDQQALYEELVTKFRKSKNVAVDTNQITTKASAAGRKNDENNPWVQLRKAASHAQQFRRFFNNERCEEMAKTLMKKVPQKELKQPSLHYLTEELKALSDFELHIWCKEYPCLSKFDSPEGALLESGKVERLFELLKEYRKNGDRALVFSRFKIVIEILGECLAEAGISCRVLHGTTHVADRQVIVDEFNEDKSIDAFLLTTMTGGQGLNLTSANKVIIFDQSDNPQHDVQAENRVHRLGQTKEVDIVRLLTRDTIDELIYKACQKKLELAGQITGFNEELGEVMEREVMAEVTKMIMNGEGGGGSGYITPPKEKDDK